MSYAARRVGRKPYEEDAPMELPRIYTSEPLEVERFSPQQRRRYGLSTLDTIVQITQNEQLHEVLEYARQKKRITVDFETGGEGSDALDPWAGSIELVQIGDSQRQYIIWGRYITDWTPIYQLLADTSIRKLGQNLKFDMRFWLVKHGLERRWVNVADAGIVEQVLGCGLFAEGDDGVGFTLKMTSMSMMVRRWLGLSIPKNEDLRTGWHLYTPDTLPVEKLLYAADDVCLPEQILKKQGGWVKRLGLVETVKLEHAFLPVIADSEVRGIRLNMEKWSALTHEAQGKVLEARRVLDHLFEVTINVEVMEDGEVTITRNKNYGSKDQLRDLIRDYMLKHHGVTVIACNRHFMESLIANGFNPVRAARLFEQSKVENVKKPGSFKKVGAPNMTDLCEKYWEQYSDYLPADRLYLPNTESKTLRMLRIIHATASDNLDPRLPSQIGLPATLVDPILDLRKYAKIVSTYGLSWKARIKESTGRLHVDSIQTALTTGRVSTKPNIQNPPNDQRFRDCFEAEGDTHPVEPSVFVGADWDQIEPRIIAQMSDCFAYKRVFFSKHPERAEFRVYCQGVTEALDLYTEIGKNIGVIPTWMTVLDTKGDEAKGIAPSKEGKAGRKQAKVVVLGLGYGTGKNAFYLTLVIDTGEVQDGGFSDNLYDRFWEALPEVKKTLDTFSTLAYPGENVQKWGRTIRKKSPRRAFHPIVDGEVTWAETLGGRKRFYRPSAASWFTTGRNMPVQGTGADILKRTMVLWQTWAWENLHPQFGFVNNIHDELIAEVPASRSAECYEKLCAIMQEVGEAYCPDVPITTAGYTALHWVKD